MTFDSRKKVAIVTGSSRGLGHAITKTLRSNNIDVIGVSRNPIEDQFHKKCDIRREKEVRNLIDLIIKKFKKIDILVNNAGVFTNKDISKTKLDDWNNVINTNLTGAFLLSKYILPHMRKKKYGKIINISSIAGRSFSQTASVEYTVSKYGLIGLTKQLAQKYGKHGININCLCPSQIRTEMLTENINANDIKKIERRIPLNRIASPEEVANVVLFLCSEKSKYIHGSALDINGGQL